MIVIQEDLKEISRLAAKAIIDGAKKILENKNKTSKTDKNTINDFVTLALPGGRSVNGIYSELKKIEDPIWRKIHIFLVDERAVPITDAESNFKLIWESFAGTLVKKGFLPLENLHPLKIDDSSDYGAKKYMSILEKYGSEFDIVLVSSGEDGHIAALYPDHKAMKHSGREYIFLDDSPKPPSNRITSSVELIHKAKLIILLFIGESKREAYEKFNNERIPILDCPAKLAQKVKNSIVYTDLK